MAKAFLLALPAALAFRTKPEASEMAGEMASDVDPLLPWAEARGKAEQVLDDLSPSEKSSLVHGSMAYQPGWYTGNTQPIPRLKLPALTMQDGGNGYHATSAAHRGGTIMWPSALALASTWDETLVQQVASAMGREFRGKGANVMLGPSVNVHRIASSGRNWEYLSGEDPYLGARLVRRFVRGVQNEGVLSVVKHFAFDAQESKVGWQQEPVNNYVDSRTAWELYYPPFEAAVQEGVAAFMCAKSKINGTNACENQDLLTRDLRGQMGFQGFVVSDWGATHGPEAVKAGLDQDMPGSKDVFNGAVELAGSSYANATEESVKRVLAAMYRLRMDRRPLGCKPPNCHAAMMSNQRTPSNARLAREAAASTVVLLKNTGMFPLDATKIKRLAVLGKAATSAPSGDALGSLPDFYSGGGSGHVPANQVWTPLDSIRARAAEAGIEVLLPESSDLAASYNAALKADAVLIIGATSAMEGFDRNSLKLDDGVDALASFVGPVKPTAVLFQAPGAVLMPWRVNVSAIACMFLGGEETGRAWASVIFGDHEPEGRLPIMMPDTLQDTINPDLGVATYPEGLFTSYRSQNLKAAYPFGHGLSYTKFEYSKPVSFSGVGCQDLVCVRTTVTNTGSRMGKEVAQVYLHFPPSTGEPNLVLRGFRKTPMLVSGQSEEIVFSFTSRDISTYDVASGGWVEHAGVVAYVGSSSRNLPHWVELAATVEPPSPPQDAPATSHTGYATRMWGPRSQAPAWTPYWYAYRKRMPANKKS